MTKSLTVFAEPKTKKVILILIIANALFWSLGKFINVYRFAVVGAIFELLWLPSLIGLFILPILSIIAWYKEKFDLRSLYFYSTIIAIITMVVTICYKP